MCCLLPEYVLSFSRINVMYLPELGGQLPPLTPRPVRLWPAGYLMIIVDETHQEEENDTDRRDGHERRADGTKIGGEMGQDGERRKKYSAAVIDGIKRKSRIFVGDSIVRKTDSRLNKGEDVVVCLPGARIEHVTERVENIMGRGKGGTILVHIGTNNADKEGTTAIVDKYRKLLKKTK